MKNYYDELEVSRNASPEIISRAYKVLAKKYHPDTTKENKKIAEERFKKISQAYETLSDKNKRKAYDEELNRTNPQISTEEYQELLKNNQILQAELADLNNKLNTIHTTNYVQHTFNENTISRQMTNNSAAPIRNHYARNNRSTPQYSFFDLVRFKLNHLLKNIIAVLLTILFIVLIVSILLYIPYTRDLLLNDMGFGMLFQLFN